MDVVIALAAILIPASVALVGYWLKGQSDKRLEQEQRQTDKRLTQQHEEEKARLRLDAAMRAAGPFGPARDTPANPAASASGLLALTELGHADLAVALLVDLWSIDSSAKATNEPLPDAATNNAGPDNRIERRAGSSSVSTETTVLVINAALQATDSPNAQLVAAELLCRNATRLDPSQSLHWPAAIDGRWMPGLAMRAKLLIVDGLVRMTSSSPANENALRSLVVRLYGIWQVNPITGESRGVLVR